MPAFGTSTTATILSAWMTNLMDQQSDVLILIGSVSIFATIVGLIIAAMSRARRMAVGSVGGGRRRR